MAHLLPHSRILSADRVKRPGRQIEWRCSYRVYHNFMELLRELVDLEYQPQQDPDVQDRMEALRDAIRRLPGYPRTGTFHPDQDTIVPTITTVSR